MASASIEADFVEMEDVSNCNGSSCTPLQFDRLTLGLAEMRQ